MEAQTSAQLRAASTDVHANLAPVIVPDHAFVEIRRTTIECALGAANAAGA